MTTPRISLNEKGHACWSATDRWCWGWVEVAEPTNMGGVKAPPEVWGEFTDECAPLDAVGVALVQYIALKAAEAGVSFEYQAHKMITDWRRMWERADGKEETTQETEEA